MGTRLDYKDCLKALDLLKWQDYLDKYNIDKNKILNGAITTEISDSKKTFLTFFCSMGRPMIVEKLIALGANVNNKDLNGRTPIDIALFYNDTVLIKIIHDNTKIRKRKIIQDAIHRVKGHSPSF